MNFDHALIWIRLLTAALYFQLMYPDRMDALVLINCSSTKAGWMEWAYQKVTFSLH